MNSADIITEIRLYLGQPIGIPEPSFRTLLPDPVAKPDLTRLAMLTQALRWDASQVGTIPQGYPLSVNLVIKAIHRLLPWYTRPIQNFSRRCAEQSEEVAHQIGVLVQAQAELLARLKDLEQSRSPDPERCLFTYHRKSEES